jgi:outer membrane protein TolC
MSRFFALLVVGGVAGCGPVGTEDAVGFLSDGAFEVGLRAYVQGDLERARRELEKFLADHPEDRRAADLLEAVVEEGGGDLRPHSEPEPPRSMSAEEIARASLGRNPEIRAAVFRVIEARAQLRDSNLSWSPRLTGIWRFTPEGAFAGLIQPVIDALWKRPALMGRDEQRMLAACAAYAAARVDVAGRAALACVDWREAAAARGLLARERPVALEKLRVTRERVRAGRAPESERLGAESELAELAAREAAAAARLETARARINVLMGRPVEEPREVSGGPVDETFQGDRGEMIARARAARAEIQEALHRARGAAEEKKVVSAEMVNADLRGGYGYTRRESGEIHDGWSAESRFWVPALIAWLLDARTGQKEALSRQFLMEAERWRGQVALETLDAYEKLTAARAGRDAAEKELAWAAEELRVAEAAERWGGRIEKLDVLRAQEKHLQAEQKLAARSFESQRASVALYRAMAIDPRYADPSRAAAPPRAMWVWRDVAFDPDETEFLVDFARARRIDFLFVLVDRLGEAADPHRRLVRLASRQKIRVQALARLPLGELADSVERYNRESSPEERFDALRIGPPPKDAERDGWLKAVAACRRPGLRLAADLPSEWLPDGWTAVDEAASDTAAGSVPADKIGWIAVGTDRRGEPELDEALERVAVGWGAAIQDFDGYRRLILRKEK